MTDGSPAAVLDDDALDALLERPFTELATDELMAMKATLEARGVRIYSSLQPAEIVLVAGAASYATMFVQTLAKHHAEALINAVQTRFRRKDKTLELVVGCGDDAAAFIVTGDLTDDAKLAMLEMDVTSDDVRGRLLRWNQASMAWRSDKTGTSSALRYGRRLWNWRAAAASTVAQLD